MEGKEPSGSQHGLKTVPHITSLRTWCLPLFPLAALLPTAPGCQHFPTTDICSQEPHWMYSFGSIFQKTGSKSPCPDYIQLIGPCFRWHPWSGAEQIEDERVGRGGGRGKSEWPRAQNHTAGERQRGWGAWDSPQVAPCEVALLLGEEEDCAFISLGSPSAETNCSMVFPCDLKAGMYRPGRPHCREGRPCRCSHSGKQMFLGFSHSLVKWWLLFCATSGKKQVGAAFKH